MEEMHMGNVIRQKLKECERTNAWLARKLHTDNSNMSKILKRRYIDAELLLRISLILHEDLFAYYSVVYKIKMEQHKDDI